MRKPSRSRSRIDRRNLLRLLANHMRPKIAVGPISIPFVANPFRQIEDNRHRQAMKLPAPAPQAACAPPACTFVASITTSFPAASRFDAMKCSTSNASLVAAWLVFVVGHQSPAVVRRKHFRRSKMFSGKARLTRSRRADQRHHRELGNLLASLNRMKTPICVGLPTTASSGPIGRNCTAYPKRSAMPFAHA